MTSFLIAPSEPPEIAHIGQTSSVPEQLGVDILWSGSHGLCGVQRKTVADLIASARDTRLGREFEQMQRLAFRALVVEGTPSWTRDGELLGRQNWTLKNHRGVLLKAQTMGVLVLTSRDHMDTIAVIEHLVEWSEKEERTSTMLARGNGKGDAWGKLTDKATAVHFLSGIPGFSTVLAERVFDHFGRVPIVWDVTKDELLEVHGVGKKKVDQLLKLLEQRQSKD